MAVVESSEGRKRMAAFWLLAGMVMHLLLFIGFFSDFLGVLLSRNGEISAPSSAFLVVWAGLFYLGLLGSLRMDRQLVLVGLVGQVLLVFYALQSYVHDLGVLMAKGSLGSTDCLDDGFYDQHKGYCDNCTVFTILIDIAVGFGGACFVYVNGRLCKAIHILKNLPELLAHPPSSTLCFIRILIESAKDYRPLAPN